MSNNTVTLTFKVNSDGKLEQVAQQADKAAAATNRAGAAADKYSKKQKGVAQAGMNSTKAFSKMTTDMGGSGGLVAAYAGLAANIFALTAGFGALSRAARATQLEQGLVAMGQASGLAMGTLSKGLVEATGHAISLEEAMRSVALITSAGIDAGSIERFGEVAKKAATALGRDVQDSISRLTRGVTKLEPELLDELGIMVRLDEASKTYADTIGKSVSDLTNFEKRQAFLNATLEEGEKKFGALGKVDVNPYDKLSASLQNLAKSGIGNIAGALGGIVNFLAEKPMALTGVLVLFASTISNQVVGSLSDMTRKTEEQSKATMDLNKKKIKDLRTSVRSSKTMRDVIASMDDGRVSSIEYGKAIKGQLQSQKTNLGLLKRGQKGLKSRTITEAEYNKRIRESNRSIMRLNIAQSQGVQSSAQHAAAKAQAAMAEGRYSIALKNARRAMILQIGAFKVASRSAMTFAGAMNMAKIAANGMAMAAKTLGAAMMNILGIIGMVIMAVQMLISAFTAIVEFFKSDEQKEYERSTKALAEAQSELATNLREVDHALEGTSEKITTAIGSYTALDNSLSTFLSKYKELDRAGQAANGQYEEQADALNTLVKSSKLLTQRFAQQFDGATTVEQIARKRNITDREAVVLAARFTETIKNQASAIRGVGESSKTATEAIREYNKEVAVKTPLDNLISNLENLTKSLFKVNESGEITGFVDAIEQGTVEGEKILAEAFDSTEIQVEFGVSENVKNIEKIQKGIIAVNNQIAKDEETLRKIRSNSSASEREEYEVRIKNNRLNIAFMKKTITEQTALIGAQIPEHMKILNAERERILNQRAQTDEAKTRIKIEKQLSSNTIASLENIMSREQNLRDITTKHNIDRINFLEKRKANLEKVAEADRTQEQKNEIIGLQNEINTLEAANALLKAEQVIEADKALRIAKMRVAILGEDQKGAKALLEITKRQIKAESDRLNIAQKIAEANVRAANRSAGNAGTITPAQKAAMAVDETLVKEKKDLIVAEAKAKIEAAKLDREMNKARLAVVLAEIELINAKRAESNKRIETSGSGQEKAKLIDTTALQAAFDSMTNSGLDQVMKNILLDAELQLMVIDEQVATTNVLALKNKELEEIGIKKVENEKQLLSIHESILQQQEKQAQLNRELATVDNTFAHGGVESATEAARIAQQARNEERAFEEKKLAMLKGKIALEEKLLEAKFRLLVAEMQASDGGIDENEAAVLNAHKEILVANKALNQDRLETANKEFELANKKLDLEDKGAVEKGARAGGMKGFLASVFGQNKEGTTEGKDPKDVKAIQIGQLKESEKIKATIAKTSQTETMLSEARNNLLAAIHSAILSSGTPGDKPGDKPGNDTDTTTNTTKPDGTEDPTISKITETGKNVDNLITSPTMENATMESDPTIDTAGGEAGGTSDPAANPVVKMGSDLSNLRGLIAGTSEEMKKLGPEGEGIAAVMDGALEFSAAMNSSMGAGEKMGAMVGAVAGMLAGASKAKIANIDKEIAAEQKRDGKSAESLAKIKALQKKKEAEEKKAFKRKKMAQMAETVINTATGIMGYMAQLNIPMAVATGIMGAAQLAIIASQKYTGGSASAPTASMPTNVSSGKRESKVDLAKGNNTFGETVYMRGGRGQGSGMTDFKPAFSGYKHRAEGGPTGFLVGEQGPELFMPQQPGDIIPAGDTEEITQSTPTNVSFNISAVDAKGVEEMLMDQRGSIIGMIREAANENGQLFLEDVEDINY